MTEPTRTPVHAPRAQDIVRELLEAIGEDDKTAQRLEIVAASGGMEINVERLTGERASAPGEPRPTELRHYRVTPEPVEVVDLVAALRASVDAAKARREGRK